LSAPAREPWSSSLLKVLVALRKWQALNARNTGEKHGTPRLFQAQLNTFLTVSNDVKNHHRIHAGLLSLPALADKYGIDEATSESEGGIGAIIATIALLIYVHFKG
jgi:hypothetical protein